MEPLGEGTQGTTFRGIDRDTGRDVAIKVLSIKGQKDWRSFDLFEREVKVLATLDHPGIPKFIDHYASEESGDYFLVMTLAEGSPLSKRMETEQRLPPRQLQAVFKQMLDILEYLHGVSPPVVHRDIKPANVMLDASGRVCLVDFGGVRRAALDGGGSTVVGTFGYMAPEQLHGEATERSDLYGLGATMAALATGTAADRLPHDGLRIDLSAVKLPAPLDAVLPGMLEPDPKSRLVSVKQVRALMRPSAASRKEAEPQPADGETSNLPARRESSYQPPASLRQVASVPWPLSILVWVMAAVGAGVMTLTEVVFVPLIAWVAREIEKRDEESDNREKLERQLGDVESTVRDVRLGFSYVAERTNPLQGRRRPPPSLPPAEG